MQLCGEENLAKFVEACMNIKFCIEDENNLFENENLYKISLGIHEMNKLKVNDSSIGILHINLASLNKHHNELELVLSLLKPQFHKVLVNIEFKMVKLLKVILKFLVIMNLYTTPPKLLVERQVFI